MTAKRFLNEDDKTDLQTGLEAAIKIANEASETVQEVSAVAQAAAENAAAAYSPKNKPTAEDVGARPDDWFPTAADVGAILSSLPTVVDANTSIAESNPTGIKIERWEKTTLNTPYTQGLTTSSNGVVITAVIKGTFATQLSFLIGGRGLYIRHNIVGSIYAWTEYGDFKADGSVPMTGEVLTMSNGEGSIENNGISASIRVRNVANDDSNSVQFILDNSFRTAPYRKLLLRETVDGVKTDYRLYGEHNKPTASDVGARPSTWTPTASDVGALPLDGSRAMIGALKMNGNNITISPDSNWSSGAYSSINHGTAGLTLTTRYDGVNRNLTVNNTSVALQNALSMWDTTTSGTYYGFGTHNKPTGSYTGNGSSTQRTIQVPHILESRGILIYADTGSGNAGALVTQCGAFILSASGTVSGLPFGQARWSYGSGAGNLVLTTTSDSLNKNGVKYNYQVL